MSMATENRVHLLIGVRSDAVHAVAGANREGSAVGRRGATRGPDPEHPLHRLRRDPTESKHRPIHLGRNNVESRCNFHPSRVAFAGASLARQRPYWCVILLAYTVHRPILCPSAVPGGWRDHGALPGTSRPGFDARVAHRLPTAALVIGGPRPWTTRSASTGRPGSQHRRHGIKGSTKPPRPGCLSFAHASMMLARDH